VERPSVQATLILFVTVAVTGAVGGCHPSSSSALTRPSPTNVAERMLSPASSPAQTSDAWPPTCRRGQLSVDVSAKSGTTDGLLEFIQFRDIGSKPCLLDGKPKVEPLTKSDRPYPVVYSPLSGEFDDPRPIALMPHERRSVAFIDVSVLSSGNITCHWKEFSAYRVNLPDRDAVVVPIPRQWALGTCNHAFRSSAIEASPG
jgi:hypothetical protein